MAQTNVICQSIDSTTCTWVSNSLNSYMMSQSATPLLEIVPRRADRIFTDQIFSSPTTKAPIAGTQIRNRLPHWRSPQQSCFSLDSGARIKEVESRFFIDFATQIQGQWWAKRKLSIICLYRMPNAEFQPVVRIPIRLTRAPADHPLRFVAPNGTFVTELANANCPRTNEQGIAEFAIAHPLQDVPVNQQNVTLTVNATVPLLGSGNASTSTNSLLLSSTFSLSIKRNNQETTLANIYSRPLDPDSALEVWCHQPAAPEARNAGIRELQDVINEVVSRHRRINNFHFVPLTGVFDTATRTALGQYIDKFRNVTTASGEYPYNLSNIGPDQDFLTGVKEDYAPFDPTTAANRGSIVDRRMLIGDQLSYQRDRIDGLWEIYQGVVGEFKTQIRAFAQSYLDCDTFWLHRPIHGPYSPANDPVFGCRNNNVIVRISNNNTAQALSQNGVDAEINDGDHFLVLAQAGSWVQIQHPAGVGWVTSNSGVVVMNDRGAFRAGGTQIQNHGVLGIAGAGYATNHTLNGVAYTYGGKQTPEQWRNSLNTNPHANPDQIVNYSEYAAGHRFGERKAEYDAGTMTWREAGCDCSGFIQNCIMNSFFPNTNIRIIPPGVINLPWLGSGQFIGANRPARPVNNPIDLDHQWVHGGDLISGLGHIVMIAEDNPTIIGSTDFKIMHECGSDNAADVTQFRRKSVRSPFSWYHNNCNGLTIGKVYIWH